MKIVRPAALAGLVLVAGALPVTAYALSSDDTTPPPAASQHAKPDTADDPETEAPETEAPETDAPEPAETEASGEPNPASAPGRAHAAAMQAWAHCVGQAASGPKAPGQQMPPKLACGAKPVAPGRAKHQPPTAPGAAIAPKGAPGSHGHGHAGGHAKGPRGR
jgi:hypothetical protein